MWERGRGFGIYRTLCLFSQLEIQRFWSSQALHDNRGGCCWPEAIRFISRWENNCYFQTNVSITKKKKKASSQRWICLWTQRPIDPYSHRMLHAASLLAPSGNCDEENGVLAAVRVLVSEPPWSSVRHGGFVRPHYNSGVQTAIWIGEIGLHFPSLSSEVTAYYL